MPTSICFGYLNVKEAWLSVQDDGTWHDRVRNGECCSREAWLLAKEGPGGKALRVLELALTAKGGRKRQTM